MSIKEEPTVESFHDINLNDDAPKLEFDFETKATKPSGLDMAGSSWGGWGSTSKWSFGSIGDSKKEEEDKVTNFACSLYVDNLLTCVLRRLLKRLRRRRKQQRLTPRRRHGEQSVLPPKVLEA